MGNFRPLSTKCWEKFLTSIGFKCRGTKGSHDLWTKNGYRTIPVWGNEKQIPAMHLKTSCRTIGTTLEALYIWSDENC